MVASLIQLKFVNTTIQHDLSAHQVNFGRRESKQSIFSNSLDNAKMYQEHLCVLWKHICIMPILMGKNGMSSIVSGYSYLVAVNFFGFL